MDFRVESYWELFAYVLLRFPEFVLYFFMGQIVLRISFMIDFLLVFLHHKKLFGKFFRIYPAFLYYPIIHCLVNLRFAYILSLVLLDLFIVVVVVSVFECVKLLDFHLFLLGMVKTLFFLLILPVY
jgi:hypothetical protein